MNTIWMASMARAGGIETDPADWMQRRDRRARADSQSSYRYRQGLFTAVQRFAVSRMAAFRRNRALSVVGGLDSSTLEDIGIVRGQVLEMRRAANANLPAWRRSA